jgi:hypothetical protein
MKIIRRRLYKPACFAQRAAKRRGEMFLTRQDKEAILATHEFWIKHNKAPQRWRNLLVKTFVNRWKDKIDLTKPIMKHPATKRRDYEKYSVLDVMTDFLLDVDQVIEKRKEYPVQNPDKRANEINKKHQREVIIRTDWDYEKEGPIPRGYIDEAALKHRNPIEEIFFSEPRADTVDELRALIDHVKANEDKYVAKYENPFRNWNDNTPNKKRTAENIRKAIRQLDKNRVRVCEVCGGAFYAHDLRRQVCDLQRGIKAGNEVTDYSACELKRDRKKAKKHREINDLVYEKSIM